MNLRHIRSILASVLMSGAGLAAAGGISLTVTPTELTTIEHGGPGYYAVSLPQAPDPGEVVTVTPDSGDLTEFSVSSALVFDDSNWNQPQFVEVTALDDAIADGDVQVDISHTVGTVGGTRYIAALAATVVATNRDDESSPFDPEIRVVSFNGNRVAESGNHVSLVDFTALVFGSLPSAEITFDLTNNNPGDVTLSTTTVTLNDGNGYSQTVLITAIRDDIDEPLESFSITTSATSSIDQVFNGLTVHDLSGLVEDGNARVGGTLVGLADGGSITLRGTFSPPSCKAAELACKVESEIVEDLVLGANGSFQFDTILSTGDDWSVDILTLPANPAQSCTVQIGFSKATNGTINTSDDNSTLVACAQVYSVGGTLTGLADGTTVVLRNSYAPGDPCKHGGKACKVEAAGDDDLSVTANGSFSFPVQLSTGDTYSVDVLTQPSSPDQACIVERAAEGKAESGAIGSSDVEDLLVTCTPVTYTIGGTVSGLLGSGLQLQNNGGDTLDINSNGSYTFATALADGSDYAVTIFSQPSSPTQTCSIETPLLKGALGSGTLNGGDVTWINITCSTPDYAIGGTLSGLASGNSVVLRNTFGSPTACKHSADKRCKGVPTTEDLELTADGAFAFVSRLNEGIAFDVEVLTQPTSPNQTCAVSAAVGKAGGTVGNADVTYLQVICTTDTYTIGGSVSGLLGSGLQLQNNGGDTLDVSSNGSYTFATALADGSAYAVSIFSQPSSPTQTCSIVMPVLKGAPVPGAGTLNGSNVTWIDITCSTPDYAIGGTLSGLASGNSVVLRNTFGLPTACKPSADKRCKGLPTTEDLELTADGAFSFASRLTEGTAFDVEVLTQPTSPNQTCAVSAAPAKAGGTVGDADVDYLQVVCTTDTYTVGGSVSGLLGSGLQLQNNGGDTLAITADGAFAFPTALEDGSPFAVSILTQPSTPAQTCSVGTLPVGKGVPGSGVIDGANVTWISIDCSTTTYSIGGTLSGLAAGNSVVVRNSHAPPIKQAGKVSAGDDDLELTSNGSFTFATRLSQGDTYSVDVLTQPSSPNQTCTATSAAGKAVIGTIGSADVGFILIDCVTDTYTVGGSVSGLTGSGLQLQNNGGDTLELAAAAVDFTFATALPDQASYAVTVLQQPSTPDQICTIGPQPAKGNSGSGVINGANVTDLLISCVDAAAPPGAPTDVQVTLVGAGGMQVSWTPPTDDGGSPITSYTITATPGGATCTVTGDPPPTQCTFDNLPPGMYTFSVVASNAAGAGGAGTGNGGAVPVAAPAVIPGSSTWSLLLLAVLLACGSLIVLRVRAG